MYTAGLLVCACMGLSVAPPPLSPGEDWWRTAVFYEIFVRSFADSTQGPLAGDGVGDLRGLLDRLDYLNDGDPHTADDLGVTGIWLMPIAQSRSYHGYDVTDYRTVDDEYGTNEDFKALVAACHARGIRVILDTVMNHVGIDHPWFQQAIDPASDKRDWFVWRDEPLTGEGAPNHPVWHDKVRDRAGQYYYGFFWHGMPDLNLRSQAASEAMYDQCRYWITDMGADGLRLDAVKHLIEDGVQFENTPQTIAWLRDFNRVMHQARPGVFLVGEVWDDTDVVAQYVNDGIDSAFEFSTCFAVEKGINAGKAETIARALDPSWKDLGGAASTMIGNHDMDRVMSRLGGNREKAACAATIQFTAPGVPFIYYGEEIGMTGVKPDPDLRTPMQWTGDGERAGFTTGTPWKPVDSSVEQANVERQQTQPDSLFSTYRRLIALRQAEPALHAGGFALLDAGDERVLVFVRSHARGRLLVVVNVSGDTLTGDWGVDAASLGVKPGAALKELLHNVPVLCPAHEVDPRWRALGRLDPYTGYVVRLP
ncbi:MAG: DUF3459 domain-containing protein [Leptolyngbya sp. PLA3]|nr:MAG: DUF3459 domain-containing protein [Cyanobacteria bacterium CYA]MCE7968221.1 DUF3459 domain-containing protein [Leptolyngbya sp. PL-A3]